MIRIFNVLTICSITVTYQEHKAKCRSEYNALMQLDLPEPLSPSEAAAREDAKADIARQFAEMREGEKAHKFVEGNGRKMMAACRKEQLARVRLFGLLRNMILT